jgi:hypothetical protein
VIIRRTEPWGGSSKASTRGRRSVSRGNRKRGAETSTHCWTECPERVQAVRKLARSISSQKVLLKLLNLKTKSAGDDYPKKAIENTVLRFLGSHTFSHGLGRERPEGRAIGIVFCQAFSRQAGTANCTRWSRRRCRI